MSLRLSISFFLLLILSSIKQVKAEPLLNFHTSVGLGLRYSGWTFPFPNLHVNTKLGNGLLFAEGSASVLAFIATVGYEYKLSNNSSLYLAKSTGFSWYTDLSGYKIGYVYNSNGFNKSGWVTSLELYSYTKTLDRTDDPIENHPIVEKSSHVIPSISFGYQW